MSSQRRWHDAAATQALRGEVLQSLIEQGPGTDARLERLPAFAHRRLGYSTLRTRRTELKRLGLVASIGTTYEPNREGKLTRMTVWGATLRGHEIGAKGLADFEASLADHTIETKRRSARVERT